MKDRAALLFLAAIVYAGLVGCLLPLTPIAHFDPSGPEAMTGGPAMDPGSVRAAPTARADHPRRLRRRHHSTAAAEAGSGDYS